VLLFQLIIEHDDQSNFNKNLDQKFFFPTHKFLCQRKMKILWEMKKTFLCDIKKSKKEHVHNILLMTIMTHFLIFYEEV